MGKLTKSQSMKSTEILQNNGYRVDTYPADACIGNELIGTYNHTRSVICLTIADNDREMITRQEFKEIAYTCKTLITDMGIEVHTHDIKNTKPYNQIEIIKISNLWKSIKLYLTMKCGLPVNFAGA